MEWAIDLQHCQADVHPVTMQRVIRVESNGNPYAIGVVGTRLVRQPQNLAEAIATAENLEKQGFNYSVGISQVNKTHFQRLSWNGNLQEAFDPCKNIKAGAAILKDCYDRAKQASFAAGQPALEAALSCYYSGSFTRGAQLGYVTKVLGSGKVAGDTRAQPPPKSKPNPTPPKTQARSMWIEQTPTQKESS